MILVGDTSGLVAALNVDDPEHAAARQALIKAALTVISPLVLLEIEHVTTRSVGRREALAINDWLLTQERTGRVAVDVVPARTLRTARAVQNRYETLQLDLTDAVTVVLAQQYETNAVLTLDRRDFRAIVPLNGAPAFRLLPDDA
ncbi:type II toxin-antitoxin system VapC family toxin [Mycolicibacter sinensis]|uniref:Ribonuclease VapC n=1 Tax=Mycolicibacter sinensis (strain JDM601) TaxID=875328 RepID=A0A1A2P0V3_MYCSD|nr:PIN domain-containing protein [Mycolicibacter sinensis]OBH20952.1 twitching motility protein PilT [Mycolicibacter sinensis]OBI33640.1 twitching motility protein PilT [Mycolicibacter sinensis]